MFWFKSQRGFHSQFPPKFIEILHFCFSSASVSSWRQIFPTCEMPQKSSQLILKHVDDVDAVFVVVVIFFAIVIAFDIVVVIVVDN